MPEIWMAVLALSLLVLEVVFPKLKERLVPFAAIAGQIAILVMVVGFTGWASLDGANLQTSFNGLLQHSFNGHLMRVFFLICGIFVSVMANTYLRRRMMPRVEFFHIIIVTCAALMLLAQSSDFIMLFVALETVTIAFYVLVAYTRYNAHSLEAALKYLIMGGSSSAILLFGIVLLYGVGSMPGLTASTPDSMNYFELGNMIAFNQHHPLILLGAAMVLCGVCFKIGVVPFQIWVPDVYQGAPIPVTSFLAVASKAGGFIVLINLVEGPFNALGEHLVPLLAAVAAATILFGNLAALEQRNVKRLLGLSGVSHAGYMLMAVAASFAVSWANTAVIFYLFVYLLGSFAVFGVMNLVSPADDSKHTLDDYSQLLKNNPFLAGVLVIGLGSLAGIPPLGGFIAKVMLFIAAYQAGLTLVLGVALLGVVLSIYYYFGWILSATYRQDSNEGESQPVPSEHTTMLGLGMRVALSLLCAATILLGFYQGFLDFNF